MKLTYQTQPHGTRLSFAGVLGVAGTSKPLAQGVRAWRLRPMGISIPGATQVDHSSTENCTRVSRVEHRHT
ncbi:hypothetical protein [Pseudonocardia lacus]|jgi:hypothetical protein|uniref:hypothetical protein n=1 Tax=Pseudonocardia lacus TaxID=2835865 RepID=UPI001BDD0D68|nr:hypothetical protein [Pseudonocardia lacus]